MALSYSCFRHLAARRGLSSWLLAALLLVSHLAPAQCLSAASCQPGSAPANSLNLGFGILRVQLANLDTTTNGAGDGYQDYSCRRAARLDRGTTYMLHVTTGPNADERVRVWADFNQDGVFSPTTEFIFSSVGRQHAGNFTVPTTLSPGASLRLRLAADYVDAPLPGPCTTPQYSQTEDYRVIITAASPPRPGAQFSAADSVTCAGTVQLRDRSRNAPTSWRWNFGDGTTSTQQHPTHVYSAAGTYTVKLRVCNASGCDSLMRAGFVTVRADGPKPAPCQPATVAYCCNFGLARVRLAGLDHRPGGGAASYQDASCSYRATVRADWPDTLRLTTGGAAAHDVRVYLDLNNDGQFTPATELLYQGLGVINPVVALRISSLTAGLVYNQTLRLRIWADYAGSPGADPCAAPQWGQVADYSVVVLPNGLAPQARFGLTYTQFCGPVQVQLTNSSQGQTSVQWDFGDGTSSTAATPPIHVYATPGLYELRLVASNVIGHDTLRRLIAAPGNCPMYCVAGGTGGTYDNAAYFTRVKLHTLDNTQTRPPGVGYRDYTSLYTELQQGQTYQLRTESPAWNFAGNGPWVRVSAWIDYNQNGVFEVRERVGRFFQLSPVVMPLTVPLGARPGPTRLRVQVAFNSQNWVTASCPPSYVTATTEDYTVVIAPVAQPPQAGFTVDLTPGCSALVQLRDTSQATPTAWYWDFGDGTTSTQQHPQHTYAQPGTYAIGLRVSNRYGQNSVNRASYLTLTQLGQGPRPAACLPPTGPDVIIGGDWEISQMAVGSWIYSNMPRRTAWRDETCAMAPLPLRAGTTVTLILTRSGSSTSSAMRVRVWLDTDDDGVLSDAECLVTRNLYGSVASWSVPVPVPPTAVLNRPLRLRVRWEPESYAILSSCAREEQSAQVRDFTVVVSTVTATQLCALLFSSARR